MCHRSTTNDGNGLNEYGFQFQQNGQDFAAIEGLPSANINGGTTMLDEINASTQPGWTTGANNNIYDFNGNLLASNATAPAGIAGDLDPTAANNPPVVDAIPNQVDDENQSVSLQVNASDPDIGDTLTYSATGLPTGLTINSTTGLISGTISFNAVLHPNLQQVFNVTVNVSDGTDTTPASFQWTVNDINRVPVALDDNAATVQDQSVDIDVQANDSDADGDILTAVLQTGTSNGAVTLNADGSFDYTPNAGFINQDSFTYFANDGIVDSNEATATINVTEVNLPPVVENPGPQTDDENTAVSLQIVADDPNGDVLAYTATGLPPGLSIGASSGVISGSISFDAVTHPDLSAVYPVTVSVTDGTNPEQTVSFDWTVFDINRAPVAVDDAATTDLDTPVTVDVLANDSDADGDALTVVTTTAPPNGSAVINPDGTVTYTPATGFTGTAAFDYTIEDGFGGSATATVTIDVVAGPPVDLDIAQFKVTKRVRLAKVKPVGIELTVKNNGNVEGDALATVTGVQNGVEVRKETLTVTDAVGNGRTKFSFTDFTPTEAGDIVWTATIVDGDPDDDTAMATTVVQ